MTTLNTIIEEEKKRFDKQYTHGGEWWKEVMVITPMMVKSFVTTAIQRAYEAGKEERDTYWKERVRTIDILASESAEYPNGLADGAWGYLGTLKTIIRDITNEDNLK